MNGEHRIESRLSEFFDRLLSFSLVLFIAAALTAPPFNYDADSGQVIVYKANADDDGDDGGGDGGDDGDDDGDGENDDDGENSDQDDSESNEDGTSGAGDDDSARSSSAQNGRDDDDAFDDMDDLDPVSADEEAGLVGNWE